MLKRQKNCRIWRSQGCLYRSGQILPQGQKQMIEYRIYLQYFLQEQMHSYIVNQIVILSEFHSQIMTANRASLAEKLSNISKCDICFSQYNRYDRQPVIICTMHHTVCKDCAHSLEATRKCPFCRENINFGKIVVNNYIFELLPNDPPPPDTRVEILQRSNARPMPPVQQQQPHQWQQQQQVNYIPGSLNYQPQQLVYPPNYFPPPPEDPQIYYIPPQGSQLDHIQDVPFQMDNCLGSIEQRLRLNYDSDRKGIYVTIFFLQLPYLFFDFLIALTAEDKACMDTPYVTKAYVLRPWLLAMGITEATIMGILFVGAILKLCNVIYYQCLKKIEFIAIAILVIKILLWLYMEMALFTAVIGPHCSGGVYAYGLVQTIIHGIFLLIICCLSMCK